MNEAETTASKKELSADSSMISLPHICSSLKKLYIPSEMPRNTVKTIRRKYCSLWKEK